MLIEGLSCPACSRPVKLSFTIADEEKTEWIFCACSSVFHQKQIDKKHFDKKYLENYLEHKGLDQRHDYIAKVYFPIIEESQHGRRFLDVGFGSDRLIKTATERGWIATGIDLVPNAYIQSDFETYDFKNEKYNLIFMGNVIECFKDPIKAIYKAKELLMKDGILFIIGSDAELIFSIGMWEFGNWNSKEKWLIFGETQMRKTLETLGFKVIVSRKNLEKRFISWNQYHIIGQK